VERVRSGSRATNSLNVPVRAYDPLGLRLARPRRVDSVASAQLHCPRRVRPTAQLQDARSELPRPAVAPVEERLISGAYPDVITSRIQGKLGSSPVVTL
jgi:hypothetical protein